MESLQDAGRGAVAGAMEIMPAQWNADLPKASAGRGTVAVTQLLCKLNASCVNLCPSFFTVRPYVEME